MSEPIARFYQRDAIDSTLLAWEEFNRVLVHSPTGSGKNFIAATLIKELQPNRCLFIGDANELCAQPLAAISRFAGIIAALDKAEQRATLNAKVVVASIQTLRKKARLERYPSDFFRYILCDEVHRITDAKAEVFDYFKDAKVAGLTATPFRANLKDLSKWFESIAFSMPMMDLIQEGFAPPMKVMTIPVEIDLSEVETKRGFDGKDYTAESLSTTIAPYYQRICELLKEHAANRQAIVFLPLIRSSEAFAEIARRVGISAMHVDGKSPDREEIIEGFKRKRFQLLSNSDLVGTGVDIPTADCFVNLCPTQSAVRYQQRVGRVMRALPGVIDDLPEKHQAAERRERIAASPKPDALLFDLLWQHDKLGVMRPGHLVAANPEDAMGIFERVKNQRSPEDLLALSKFVQEEREAKVVKRLEEVALRAPGRSLEPAAFGFIIGDKNLMNYGPIARWEIKEPSEKQLECLARNGIDASKVESRGQASKLMSAIIWRAQYQLATVNQLRALQKMSIEHDPARLTLKDASALISEAKLGRMKELF